jgi:D-glycerate 3-kinase
MSSAQQFPSHWIDAFLLEEKLPDAYRETIANVHAPLAARIAAETRDRLLTVGLCGPQGSGKSTLAASLRHLLGSQELSVATLSLDDLYLTSVERAVLSESVHPLLRTRGVPGTHDVALGIDVIAALRRAQPVALPSFDKSRDDRRPRQEWTNVSDRVDVLVFEGWCVGARPQTDEELIQPVNELERDEDADGRWRRYVNTRLADDYQRLFACIDSLVLLQAPSFDAVYHWRLEQEQKLRARLQEAGADASRLMTPAQLRRFIAHYERLTCHILREMPARADVVVPIGDLRGIEVG